MKFGVRECCDVVFRAKAPMKVGSKIFYAGEPVVYFDTLRTSTLEGAATTVYAQGGRGYARLMSWDGERTVTFTMEDALISPEGLSILTGAGLIEAGDNGKKIYIHTTETIEIGDDAENNVTAKITGGKVTFDKIPLSAEPYIGANAGAYVMIMDGDHNIISEPFSTQSIEDAGKLTLDGKDALKTTTASEVVPALENVASLKGYLVLVDYYVAKESGAMQIDITPDKFGGAFYIEGSTLFRTYPGQQDLPAEIVIPNARVQSNFTFTMSGSGDPSVFTFTMDAFPDYTKFDPTQKVFASIQVITGASEGNSLLPRDTTHTKRIEENGVIVDAATVED